MAIKPVEVKKKDKILAVRFEDGTEIWSKGGVPVKLLKEMSKLEDEGKILEAEDLFLSHLLGEDGLETLENHEDFTMLDRAELIINLQALVLGV